MPTRESEQLRRLSPPAARAAPPASLRPFPQPDPSPQPPSSVTSLCRVLTWKAAAPSFVAVPCQFHRNCLLGNLSLYWAWRPVLNEKSPLLAIREMSLTYRSNPSYQSQSLVNSFTALIITAIF